MIRNALGPITNHTYKLGNKECPIFLVDGPQPVIIDSGVTCAGEIYAAAIRSVLGTRQPSILFLTHVHWDHCGAVSYLKKAFPSLKVAASPQGEETLKRPNALALITRLNDEFRILVSTSSTVNSALLIEEPFRPFKIDIPVEDRQTFNLGGGTILQALATPGHTQDHFSYYLPHEKIMFAGEAAGVSYGPDIVSPEFVSGYDAYLASLHRLAALPAEVFCPGHFEYVTGADDITSFFNRSILATVRLKERILELLDEKAGCIDQVVQRYKSEWYDGIREPKQPEAAYLLNLRARVAHLAAKKQSVVSTSR